jgi:hypothetical protein
MAANPKATIKRLFVRFAQMYFAQAWLIPREVHR